MGKPKAAAVAARAVAAVAEGHSYAEMDCQAFIEFCVAACGGAMAYAGSNDMARHAVTGLWTLAEAKRLGKLVPGAGLFIHEEDSGEPARYKADGLGNYSHVGLYAGTAALTDTDKNGKSRACDCVHSSATMGRVAGSTLQNGWTHAGWFSAVEYGAESAGDAADSGDETAGGDAAASGQSGDTGSQSATAADAAADRPAIAATAAKSEAAVDVSSFYTVRRGCKGGAVRRLQTWLADLGYDLGSPAVDGDFGAKTETATRAFQQAQGLAADGIAGRRTWRALAQARADVQAQAQAAAQDADAQEKAQAAAQDADAQTQAQAAAQDADAQAQAQAAAQGADAQAQAQAAAQGADAQTQAQATAQEAEAQAQMQAQVLATAQATETPAQTQVQTAVQAPEVQALAQAAAQDAEPAPGADAQSTAQEAAQA